MLPNFNWDGSGAGSDARSDTGLIANLIRSHRTLHAGRGQCYFETSATLGPVGRGDGSPVLMNNAFSHREPEPGALGVQPRGYERFKNIRQNVGRDTRAVVFHGDRDPRLRIAIQAFGMNRDFTR